MGDCALTLAFSPPRWGNSFLNATLMREKRCHLNPRLCGHRDGEIKGPGRNSYRGQVTWRAQVKANTLCVITHMLYMRIAPDTLKRSVQVDKLLQRWLHPFQWRIIIIIIIIICLCWETCPYRVRKGASPWEKNNNWWKKRWITAKQVAEVFFIFPIRKHLVSWTGENWGL